MVSPPLASPDSILSQKSSLSIDTVATTNSAASSSSMTTVASDLASPTQPPAAGAMKHIGEPGENTAGTTSPKAVDQETATAAPANALTAAESAAKRRRAQTEVQRLPIRLPLKPSGSMTGNLASYGNAVTQLVPPRRIERRPSTSVDNDMAGAKGEADAITGRRRIQIGYITNETRRASTFKKRKAGLLKKAYELAELTGSHVLVVAVNDQGKCYSFATPSLQPMVTHQEGQSLLKRCLANGQVGNDSTAFQSSQSGEPSAFGAVESFPDEDDDEDDEDDSDADVGEPSKTASPAKGRAALHRAKATTASPSSVGRNISSASLSINPHASIDLTSSLSPLKPVFLSNAGSQPAQSQAAWSNVSGGNVAAFVSPPNSAPPHILAFDQAAAAHHNHQMMGLMLNREAEWNLPVDATVQPAHMHQHSLPLSSTPQMAGPTDEAAAAGPAPTRPPMRAGRQRAATMLNPIELHPIPSDRHHQLAAAASANPTAGMGFLTGGDMPSPVNALALNLGSAYIGGGAEPGHGLLDGHGHARTYDVQAAVVGRPRSLTSFPSAAMSEADDVHNALLGYDTTPFYPHMQTSSASISTSERPSSSGTLGKRKSSRSSMSAQASGVGTDTGASADVVMQQDDDSVMDGNGNGPRKIARWKMSGASPSQSGSSGTSAMLGDGSSADAVAGYVFQGPPRNLARSRSYTVGNPLSHMSMGAGGGMDIVEPVNLATATNVNISPAFLHSPDASATQHTWFHPSAALPADASDFMDPAYAAAAAGIGLHPFGPENAAAVAAAAPRSLVTPTFNPTAFSGLMMSGASSAAAAGMFDTLNFGPMPVAAPTTEPGASIDALGAVAAVSSSSSTGPANTTGGTAPLNMTSPPTMTSTTSSSSADSSAAQAGNFLHRLQQQYKEHHDVSLHQHHEFQRHYAELSAAAASAAAAAAAAATGPNPSGPVGSSGTTTAAAAAMGMSASGTPK
ncbi:transcription factor of the MADS box [Tilletia horrida]|nr:transcription factor of the MADS box [Tilletia horrida]